MLQLFEQTYQRNQDLKSTFLEILFVLHLKSQYCLIYLLNY